MHGAVLIATAVISGSSVSVQDILDHAVETAAKKVAFPEGRIEVSGKLRLRNATNLVIGGSRTTLVFSDREGATSAAGIPQGL